MQKKARGRRTPSALGALLTMSVVAALMFVGISLLFSVVTYLLKDPAAVIPLLSLPAFLISGALTSIVLRRMGTDGWLMPTLAAALFLCVLLLVGVIAAHGVLSVKILLYDSAYLLVFAAVRLLGVGRRGRHSHRRHR